MDAGAVRRYQLHLRHQRRRRPDRRDHRPDPPVPHLSGWFIGGGTEYAIGFLPGLFWKTEYRFAQYSNGQNNGIVCASTGPGVCGVVGATGYTDRSTHYQQTIRSELVWRFGGKAVVASY